LVERENRVGATVDPLAPFNVRIPPAVARRVGPMLDIDTDRPLLCHISRFAPWADLEAVIAAYWEAKSVVGGLQLVIGGAAGSRHDSLSSKCVSTRASEDPDLRQLPNLSSMEIAALRSC
jgi:trehalose synthase